MQGLQPSGYFCGTFLNKPPVGGRPTSLCSPPCDSCGWTVSSRTSETSNTIMGGQKICLQCLATHRYAFSLPPTSLPKQLQTICLTHSSMEILICVDAQAHTHQFLPVGLNVGAPVSGVGNGVQILCPLCVPLQLRPETLEMCTHKQTNSTTVTKQGHCCRTIQNKCMWNAHTSHRFTYKCLFKSRSYRNTTKSTQHRHCLDLKSKLKIYLVFLKRRTEQKQCCDNDDEHSDTYCLFTLINKHGQWMNVFKIGEHGLTFPLDTDSICSSVVHSTPGTSNRQAGTS